MRINQRSPPLSIHFVKKIAASTPDDIDPCQAVSGCGARDDGGGSN
jgi:hypothetical protein